MFNVYICAKATTDNQPKAHLKHTTNYHLFTFLLYKRDVADVCVYNGVYSHAIKMDFHANINNAQRTAHTSAIVIWIRPKRIHLQRTTEQSENKTATNILHLSTNEEKMNTEIYAFNQ